MDATDVDGGDHGLGPVTNRPDRLKLSAPARVARLRSAGPPDDFLRGSVVRVPCAGKVVRVDWSLPQESPLLVTVEEDPGS